MDEDFFENIFEGIIFGYMASTSVPKKEEPAVESFNHKFTKSGMPGFYKPYKSIYQREK
jgi:hypothetical protein